MNKNGNQPDYSNPVTLTAPLTRGEGEKARQVSEVKLRRPNAGELRGCKLTDLLQMDVAACSIILPRLAEPQLTEADLFTMNAADFTSLSLELMGFLTDSMPSP